MTAQPTAILASSETPTPSESCRALANADVPPREVIATCSCEPSEGLLSRRSSATAATSCPALSAADQFARLRSRSSRSARPDSIPTSGSAALRAATLARVRQRACAAGIRQPEMTPRSRALGWPDAAGHALPGHLRLRPSPFASPASGAKCWAMSSRSIPTNLSSTTRRGRRASTRPVWVRGCSSSASPRARSSRTGCTSTYGPAPDSWARNASPSWNAEGDRLEGTRRHACSSCSWRTRRTSRA